MEFLIVFAPAFSVLVLGLWIDSVVARNAVQQIRTWATSESYAVTAVHRSFFGGPFWYLARQGMIFRVMLENQAGMRGAWVFYPLPLSFLKMKVKWD